MNSADTAVLAQIAVVVVATFASFAVIGVAVHAYLRRARRQASPALAPAADERLQRLEQAVDAIAIEIERVSEGQRFVTKLLTEGNAPALSVGQRSAEPVRLPDREAIRASRESA